LSIGMVFGQSHDFRNLMQSDEADRNDHLATINASDHLPGTITTTGKTVELDTTKLPGEEKGI